MNVAVIVIVAVDVITPVIVAALGNGNDIVAVIDAVNAHATCIRWRPISAGMLHFQKLDVNQRAIEFLG